MREVMSASALARTHAADALQIPEYLGLELTHLVFVEIKRGHTLEEKIGRARIAAHQLTQFADRYASVMRHALGVLLI